MILVTGADGYLGWPVLLELSQRFPDEKILGVDNGARRQWVDEIGSGTALPIASLEQRIHAAHQEGFKNTSLLKIDLTNRDAVNALLKVTQPRTIVHLAAQPSAPYSHINGERANFTQENNNQMCRNLLWGMYETGLTKSHLIETTTTGIYGAPDMDIPEGFLTVEGWKGTFETVPYPGMATSWYHMSKANDANSLYLANHMWKLPITDIRTSIIFGTSTDLTAMNARLATRFDFDFYFGVVPNRFVAQAIAGMPITIYGNGEQRKPMISLRDAVTSVVNSVQSQPTSTYEVFNQFSLLVSPKDLAETIQKLGSVHGYRVQIEHIPNPRIEKEDHKMIMKNQKFRKKLLPTNPVGLEDAVDEAFTELAPYRSDIQTLLGNS